MATIKKNSPSTSSHRTQKTQKAQKPNPSRQNQKPRETKKPEGENFKASDELRESRHHGRNRDKKTEEPGKNGESDKKLEDKLSDLEKQLAELKNQPKQEAQQPQNSGGCCGGGEKGGGDKAEQSKGPKAADPAGQQNGPDGELQNMAAQVMQASGMLGAQPGMAGQVPGQPPLGQRPGVQGIQGGRGPANPQAGQLKSTLAQKAQQYAKQGFQPQPATRVLVQGALGYDPFQNPGMPQNGGNPLAPGNGAFPNPQPFGGFGPGVRVA